MQLDDWLDDLCVRFIVNLPREELESVERICFQVEEAQWFYEDFIRPLDPYLPSLNLRQFCLRIFQHCPLLSGFSPYHHSTAFSEFLAYKTRVPVRGAIMLNEAMDEVVLVKGWKKSANWSFPRGKINKDEKDLDCAIREVYEETGFDIQAAGLVKQDEDMRFVEITMREQHMRLYIFRGVPMDTYFEPRTRKEISKIQWYKLSELPTLKRSKQYQEGHGEDLAVNANKFYMVAPFLNPLKKWISQERKQDALKATHPNGIASTTGIGRLEIIDDCRQEDGIAEPSPGDDMGRLMDRLRRSGKVPTVSDLPEVSDASESAKDASNQLKSLLRVPSSVPNVETDIRTLSTAEETKSNALLALLRGNGKSDQEAPKQHVQPPQTPFGQILEPPLVAQSPQHHPPEPPHLSSFASPPPFPYHPDPVIDSTIQSTTITSNVRAPHSTPTYYPVIPHALRQPFSQAPYFQGQTSPLSIGNPLRQMQAPYHRTGDIQFAPASQLSTNHAPLIPAASKLPPPKLTMHSSALLDIFKTGKISAPSQSMVVKPSQETRQGAAATLNANPDAQVGATSQGSGSDLLKRDITNSGFQAFELPKTEQQSALPALAATMSSQGSRPRSHHHDTLLNLFRTSSISAVDVAQTTTPKEESPLAPAELSALQTPGHSRQPSYFTDAILGNATKVKAVANGHVTIQKRPVSKHSTAPVSATVTGPLNVPQFDEIHRKSREVKPVNGTANSSGSRNGRKSPSITILSRPADAPRPLNLYQSSTIGLPAQDRVQASAPVVKLGTESTASSKPFQPQILRRPPQSQAMPEFPPATRQAPRALTTQDRLVDDRHMSQPEEHKQALLSLFSKPGSFASSPTPLNEMVVSPLSERPSRKQSMLPMPLDMSSSRIGSINSAIGEDSVRPSSGKRTPKTTPVDKHFLLGYLNDVAKGVGR
ncbi:mRNA-decapping enzyme subunit 2 [Lignoscripta atroalba]|nr:mRNA-decapping enzyme subunit 2 [Lignoscripta atroalba]